ncbi:MAG: sulfatase-like hydrolase/transferase, partial [bacterium]|nr:sulfatase-like hydrolase/transferase [bacterium]
MTTERIKMKMTNIGYRLLGLALAGLWCAGAAAVDRPNIIFIMVDDLGPEWVSCYGAEDIRTPSLDKLAATGMKFEAAYSMPQCTPTRAALLTGQYPFRNGWVNHWDVPRWGAGCHFDPKHNITFARLLKKVGYKTAVAGKWQINDFRIQPNVLREHGFDEWCMWTGYESQNRPSAERYWNPYIFTTPGKSRTYEGKLGPDIYNNFVLDFLKRHRREPMLVYYPMVLTHGPLVHTPDEMDVTETLDKHKAMTRYTDKLVGRVVDTLDELKIRDRTIVIFTTDNGTGRGIRGHMNGRLVSGGKAQLTENGPRQPFIVNGPGMVPVGVTTDALTDFTDMLPTFAELAGAELPEGVTLDGRSIAKVILGTEADGPREWIMAMGFGPARLDDKGVRPVKDYTDRVV